jgi:hypothetical protein
MIDIVEFDGVDYPIETDEIKSAEKGIITSFRTAVDGKELLLSSKWDEDILSALSLIHGYDAKDELKKMIVYEMKIDIFEHIYATTAREQMDKVFALVGKDDSALDELISNDAVFAAYIRNFHPEQYRRN